MNWKKVGVALALWAALGGAVALGMAFIPEANISQKAEWARDCFMGNSSACYDKNVHDAALSEWRSRAWIVGGVSAAMLVIGLSLVAGGAPPKEAPRQPARKQSQARR